MRRMRREKRWRDSTDCIAKAQKRRLHRAKESDSLRFVGSDAGSDGMAVDLVRSERYLSTSSAPPRTD